MSVLDMTLNNLMLRLQEMWSTSSLLLLPGSLWPSLASSWQTWNKMGRNSIRTCNHTEWAGIYLRWRDHDYSRGIWSHNPVPLTTAELSNFEWIHYRFEPIDENEIWWTMGCDFCVTRTSSISSSLSGLVLKNSDMYWWWNSGRLR